MWLLSSRLLFYHWYISHLCYAIALCHTIQNPQLTTDLVSWSSLTLSSLFLHCCPAPLQHCKHHPHILPVAALPALAPPAVAPAQPAFMFLTAVVLRLWCLLLPHSKPNASLPFLAGCSQLWCEIELSSHVGWRNNIKFGPSCKIPAAWMRCHL